MDAGCADRSGNAGSRLVSTTRRTAMAPPYPASAMIDAAIAANQNRLAGSRSAVGPPALAVVTRRPTRASSRRPRAMIAPQCDTRHSIVGPADVHSARHEVGLAVAVEVAA